MKLLTKPIIKALHAADQIVQATGDTPAAVVVKFFNPTGSATWYIQSGTPLDAINGNPIADPDQAKDWHLFGLCDLFHDGGELGYVLLSELESVSGPLGLGIERDINFQGSIVDGKVNGS